MAYDRQVVVQLDFDAANEDMAKALDDNQNIPSQLVKVHGATSTGGTYFSIEDRHKLNDAFQVLTKQSRVYLVGHGDWQTQKLGIHDAETVSHMLANAGMPQVKVLSVVGCESARDLGTANDARVSNSMGSFASKLHKHLGESRQLHVRLYARIVEVTVGNPVDFPGQPGTYGRKYTHNEDDNWEGLVQGHKREYSKILFYWEDNKQKRQWAY